MTEISVIAQEIAASRRRGIPADEGKLWETLRLDAERVAAGEEMLRGFLDLVVLRHDGFASGLGVLLARKLGECSAACGRKVRFAPDSLLEGDGFEPSVPPREKPTSSPVETRSALT